MVGNSLCSSQTGSFIYNSLPQRSHGKLYQPFNLCIIITSLLSYPFQNYTTTDLMNPFSFKITPILCLEIAWENSTAAAIRAGKFAVYNQKVRVYFQVLVWGHRWRKQGAICACFSQSRGEQVLIHLMPPVSSWMLERAWADFHPRTQPIHIPHAQKQPFNFCAVALKKWDSHPFTNTDS